MWFSWSGKNIRIVSKYVYLGICFSSSGSFSSACKEAVRKGLQAQGAIFTILPKAKRQDLELANRLFDSLSCSTTLYAAGIWGLPFGAEIERVQQAYYKRLLRLPINTPRYFVRLETNKPPLRAVVLRAALGFWAHLLDAKDGSLLADAYIALRADALITNSPKTNWCCQIKQMLEITGHTYIWEQNSAAALACKRNEIIRKLIAADREADILSAQNSSSIPHYFNTLRGTVGPASYLKVKLPCYLATCAATIRLGYDRFHLNGEWYKLGSIEGTPCRLCGDNETFGHIFNDCPGLAQVRLSFFNNLQPDFNILRTLSVAPGDQLLLKKLHSYMSKVIKSIKRSAAVDKPAYFTT